MRIARLRPVLALLGVAAAAGCGDERAPPPARAPDSADAPYAAAPVEPAPPAPAPPAQAPFDPAAPSTRDETDVRLCLHLMQRLSVDAVVAADDSWFADIERLRARLPAPDGQSNVRLGLARFSWETHPPARDRDTERAQTCRRRLLARAP